MIGEIAQDSGLALQKEMSRGMKECIDWFHSELEIQSRPAEEVAALF